MFQFLSSGHFSEFLRNFPILADPWVTFFLKTAGILAVLIVPISTALNERLKQRRAAAAEQEERERRRALEKPAPLPGSIIAPMMAAYSDSATADELRTTMMTLSGELRSIAGVGQAIEQLTALIGALLAAIEAMRVQASASEANDAAQAATDAVDKPV